MALWYIDLLSQQNSVLSYFQAAAFTTAGFTDPKSQHNLTLGNACQQFFFAMVGARLVDKVGRRPLLLFSNLACAITWACMCIAASIFASSGKKNSSAGAATLAFQFIFGAVYRYVLESASLLGRFDPGEPILTVPVSASHLCKLSIQSRYCHSKFEQRVWPSVTSS